MSGIKGNSASVSCHPGEMGVKARERSLEVSALGTSSSLSRGPIVVGRNSFWREGEPAERIFNPCEPSLSRAPAPPLALSLPRLSSGSYRVGVGDEKESETPGKEVGGEDTGPGVGVEAAALAVADGTRGLGGGESAVPPRLESGETGERGETELVTPPVTPYGDSEIPSPVSSGKARFVSTVSSSSSYCPNALSGDTAGPRERCRGVGIPAWVGRGRTSSAKRDGGVEPILLIS
jgi:hypothetical protein